MFRNIILIVIMCFSMGCSKAIDIDIARFDVYGFNLSQTMQDVEKMLTEQKIQFVIAPEYDDESDTSYYSIQPKNQSFVERTNLDFVILFNADYTIKHILKFNVDDAYIRMVKKTFGNRYKIEKIDSLETITWEVDNVSVSLQTRYSSTSFDLFVNSKLSK